jgi:alpha-1,2-mannosyltransferase
VDAGTRSGWLWSGTIAAFVVVVVQVLHPIHEFDLGVYRLGAQAVLRGHANDELYALRSGFGLEFTYPPLAAVLFAPLALATIATDRLVVTLLLGFVTAGLWQVSLRAIGRPPRLLVLLPLTLVSLLIEPVWLDFRLGQISLVLVLMVVADLTGAVPRQIRGALTGLAAAIKLTPLIFLAFLALTRQWRALMVATGTFVAATVLGFLVLPHASWGYWTTYLHDTKRVGATVRIDNQSVVGVLTRLGVDLHSSGGALIWLATAGGLTAAALAVGAVWWRRGERLLGLSLAALAGLFASPISWYHHWCWVIPLVVALTRVSRIAAVLTAVPFLVARRIGIAGGWKTDTRHWDLLQTVVGNAYVWAGALVVGYAAWRLLRSTPPPERDVRTPERRGAALA